MKVECKESAKGVTLRIDGREFSLEFPQEVWNDLPKGLKKNFVDNYAFLKALHLPLFFNNGSRIDFSTSYPVFKNEIYHAFLNNVPFAADVDNKSTAEYLKRFINLQFTFSDFDSEIPRYDRKLQENAVLNMSFGKDSLLTYALAKEIGLSPNLVMSVDNDCTRENAYKLDIAKRFSQEFNVKISIITNNTSVIHRPKYWQIPPTEWGFAHLITEYCLNAFPFANHFSSKYILFGNEKSCDANYINKDGFLSYPVYDQTSDWLIELTGMTKALTGNQMRVASLIEPLNDLAVTRILHKRYPQIGKYQMSCFPDENDWGKDHYWCQHCSKCARIYIYMLANNFDPKTIGLKDSMLTKEHKSLYAMFGVEKKEGASVGYDASGVGRDEQLYAFYLAYKNGAKGELIDLFRKDHLEEAKAREEELHKVFFSVQDSKTIPQPILKKLLPIYREELAKA